MEKLNKEVLLGRIVLRKPTAADAKTFFEALDNSREQVLPWLDLALPCETGNVELVSELLKKGETSWDNGENYLYLVEDFYGNLLGGIEARKRGRDQDLKFEISFLIFKKFQRQGIASLALKALEEELFSKGANRIILRVAKENVASKELIIKADGYDYEGTERYGSYSHAMRKFVDMMVFSKCATD